MTKYYFCDSEKGIFVRTDNGDLFEAETKHMKEISVYLYCRPDD